MERVLRGYTIPKARLTAENLRRSLKGAAARAEDGCVYVMVSTLPGVKIPRKLDTLWRDRKEGCGFDLSHAEVDDAGRLSGWGQISPTQLDPDGFAQIECFTVPLAAMKECAISYLEA